MYFIQEQLLKLVINGETLHNIKITKAIPSQIEENILRHINSVEWMAVLTKIWNEQSCLWFNLYVIHFKSIVKHKSLICKAVRLILDEKYIRSNVFNCDHDIHQCIQSKRDWTYKIRGEPGSRMKNLNIIHPSLVLWCC